MHVQMWITGFPPTGSNPMQHVECMPANHPPSSVPISKEQLDSHQSIAAAIGRHSVPATAPTIGCCSCIPLLGGHCSPALLRRDGNSSSLAECWGQILAMCFRLKVVGHAGVDRGRLIARDSVEIDLWLFLQHAAPPLAGVLLSRIRTKSCVRQGSRQSMCILSATELQRSSAQESRWCG